MLLDLTINKAKNFALSNGIFWDKNNDEKSFVELFSNDKWNGFFLLIDLFEAKNYDSTLYLIKNLINKIPELKNNINFISSLVKININFLDFFSDYSQNFNVVLNSFAKYPEKILNYPQFLNYDYIKLAINYNPIVYRYIPLEFKLNKKLAILALTGSILYQKEDKKTGIFFNMPIEFQTNIKIICIALKNYPFLFHLLPLSLRTTEKVIFSALNSVFYDKDLSNYYQTENIIPYINDEFFKKSNNVIWLMKAFTENIENFCMDIHNSLISFSCFFKKSYLLNNQFNLYCNKVNLIEYFNDLVLKKTDKDKIKILKEHLLNHHIGFNKFIFYLKIKNKFSYKNCKNDLIKI